MLLRAPMPTRLPAERPRPGPPWSRSRRSGRAGVAAIVALLAVGGAACSSASAPPAAAPSTGTAGALRSVAAAVADSTTSPSGGASPAIQRVDRHPSSASPALALTASADSTASAASLQRFGGSWWCSYFAVGAASGSTMELRIDDLRGPITPVAGEVVLLQCLEGSVVAYQEISIFDPARPFASLGDILGPGVGG